jgi:hypothetical protein
VRDQLQDLEDRKLPTKRLRRQSLAPSFHGPFQSNFGFDHRYLERCWQMQ